MDTRGERGRLPGRPTKIVSTRILWVRVFSIGREALDRKSNRAGRENCKSSGIYEGKNWHQIRIKWRETKDLSNRCNEDQRKYSLLGRTWRLVLSMERIPSKPGQDWWNETLTRGMNLKNLSLLYYSFGGDLRLVFYVSLLQQKTSRYSFQVFWSLGQLSKTCLLQKPLPLSAVKAMVIFRVLCDRWCLYSCD